MTASSPGEKVATDDLEALIAQEDDLIDVLLGVGAYVKLLGEAALADTPLTLFSNRLLTTILREPGITVSEMSRRMPKTQQSLSQVAAQLTNLGLIERQLGAGRGIGLHVTPAGQRMAVEVESRKRALRTRLREILGDDRYRDLERISDDCRSILRDARR